MTEKSEDLITEARRWANERPGERSSEMVLELISSLERSKRGGAELGKMIKRQCDDIVKITDSQHLIEEDGDGDWGLVWERGFDMRERLAALTAAGVTPPAPVDREAIGRIIGPLRNRLDEYGAVPLRHAIRRIEAALAGVGSPVPVQVDETKLAEVWDRGFQDGDGVGTYSRAERDRMNPWLRGGVE